MNSARAAVIVLAASALSVCLSGCASPAQRLRAEAEEFGLVRRVLPGADFSHVVYQNTGRRSTALHVYLEGDGSPWFYHRYIAADPTPRNPLMLRLMALDPSPSVYVGRPCYLGLADAPQCGPALWTTARYGKRVLASLARVIERLRGQGRHDGVVLLGHSGGGTLAMLLAQTLEQVRAVVTVAGNLDVDAWAAHHGYRPLTGSLDPASQPKLPAHVRQLHLAGAEDTVVPPRIIQPVVARQTHAEVETIEGFDHTCCWRDIWDEVLAKLP